MITQETNLSSVGFLQFTVTLDDKVKFLDDKNFYTGVYDNDGSASVIEIHSVESFVQSTSKDKKKNFGLDGSMKKVFLLKQKEQQNTEMETLSVN